jgi:hypothetical protein
MDRFSVYVPYSTTHHDQKVEIYPDVSSPSSSSSGSSIISIDHPRKRRQHIGYACERLEGRDKS